MALAAQGIFIGTSSWKYPGWLGGVYDEQRYLTRGKFSMARFERECLSEYAELFPTVCVDAAYYTFPTVGGLEKLAAQVPAGFRFSFKVTDTITLRRYPQMPRFGPKGGTINPGFLDPEVFTSSFLGPMESIRDKVGLIMFEFSAFHSGDFARGRDFVDALNQFFSLLPKDWDLGVEIRQPNLLREEYFSMLRAHNVTHVFNSWAGMPPIADQIALPGSFTRPEVVGARMLLKPGRKYQEAVDAFQPYLSVQEPQPEVRAAAASLIEDGLKPLPRGIRYLYINNRLEGNAPSTIEAILRITEELGSGPAESETDAIPNQRVRLDHES